MPRPRTRIITLRIIESSLPGEGIARIPAAALEELNISKGDKIVVESPDLKKVVVKAYPDTIYTLNGIRMRRADIHRIGLEEGDGVVVTRRSGAKGRVVPSRRSGGRSTKRKRGRHPHE